MKEIYLHKYDIPKSCVDCDFRQGTNCKAQRIDDGEYVSCHQSKRDMKDGKPITCPLKCIESGELCYRKETTEKIYNWLVEHFYDEESRQLVKVFHESLLREKIIKILEEAMKPIEYGGDSEHAPELHYPTEEDLADALISAGIGDVSELKKHRVQITKDGTIQQLYRGEEVEQIVKERNTYKRALQIAEELGELCAPASNYIQQAEKELQEERKDD